MCELSPRKMKVAIIIPAFNEENTISLVVKDSLAYGFPIVVNDGSSDKTEEFAAESGAYVINHIRNLGYDKALESGLMAAIQYGYEIAITLDADGQHQPLLINEVLECFTPEIDVVAGYRDFYQRWSEHLFSFVMNLILGIKDPLCGMKAYRTSFLLGNIPLVTYESVGTEIVIRAAINKKKIKQIPIVIVERLGSGSRFGDGIKVNLKIINSLLMGFFSYVKSRLCLAPIMKK
jgi:glycosyltransferase involved in cell wall biosynthesis